MGGDFGCVDEVGGVQAHTVLFVGEEQADQKELIEGSEFVGVLGPERHILAFLEFSRYSINTPNSGVVFCGFALTLLEFLLDLILDTPDLVGDFLLDGLFYPITRVGVPCYLTVRALYPAGGNGQVHRYQVKLIIVVQLDGVGDVLEIAHFGKLCVQLIFRAAEVGRQLDRLGVVGDADYGQLDVTDGEAKQEQNAHNFHLNYFVCNLAQPVSPQLNSYQFVYIRASPYKLSVFMKLSKFLHQSRYTLYTTRKPMEKANNAKYKFYDIAANLTSEEFDGVYGSKNVHKPDVDQVIKRASGVGCDYLLIASGHIEDAEKAYPLCQKSPHFFTTIGVHPCRASQPFKLAPSVDKYFENLEAVLNKIKPKLVAIGECGLDYDRFHYSSKEEQLAVFPYHFALAEKYKLPMYLHNRNTGNDFYDLVKQNRKRFSSGVVHSFTGTLEELKQILELDLYVGINGCSMKTQQNLQVLKHIPLDRIMLETDSPYCEIRNSHSSSGLVKTKFTAKAKEKHSTEHLVKGRNEPCNIVQVLEVASQLMKVKPEVLAQAAFANSVKLLSL